MTGTRVTLVPVERLQQGDRILLPNSKVVVVQRVDAYPDAADGDDAIYYVRWAHGPRFTHGHRLAGEPAELGSLVPLRKGDEVRVEESVIFSAPAVEETPEPKPERQTVPYGEFPDGF